MPAHDIARRSGPDHAIEPVSALGGVPAQASRDAQGVPSDLLRGYLETLADVSKAGRRLSRAEIEQGRAAGADAARCGVSLRGVVDLYLSATKLAWPYLPGIRAVAGVAKIRETGEAVLRAADSAVAAVAEGYEVAQRLTLRREEALRREFVDHLLSGSNLDTVVEQAQRYGLRLMQTHVVAVGWAENPGLDTASATRRIEADLFARFQSRDVMVTTKDGSLICVTADVEVVTEFTRQAAVVLAGSPGWRIGVGQALPGPGGVARSFEQARTAVELAERLDLSDRVVNASRLLVFQVLLRDSDALAELVTTALGPLLHVRGGADRLLETLLAYFDSGGVATQAARLLGVGVRTVTYRLDRIVALTGFGLDDPLQRLTLEVAARGARLLRWPREGHHPETVGADLLAGGRQRSYP